MKPRSRSTTAVLDHQENGSRSIRNAYWSNRHTRARTPIISVITSSAARFTNSDIRGMACSGEQGELARLGLRCGLLYLMTQSRQRLAYGWNGGSFEPVVEQLESVPLGRIGLGVGGGFFKPGA